MQLRLPSHTSHVVDIATTRPAQEPIVTRFSSLRRSLQGQRAGGVLKDDPSPPSPNEEEERRVYHVHERLSESLAASRMLEASLVGTDAEAVHVAPSSKLLSV